MLSLPGQEGARYRVVPASVARDLLHEERVAVMAPLLDFGQAPEPALGYHDKVQAAPDTVSTDGVTEFELGTGCVVTMGSRDVLGMLSVKVLHHPQVPVVVDHDDEIAVGGVLDEAASDRAEDPDFLDPPRGQKPVGHDPRFHERLGRCGHRVERGFGRLCRRTRDKVHLENPINNPLKWGWLTSRIVYMKAYIPRYVNLRCDLAHCTKITMSNNGAQNNCDIAHYLSA